MKVKIGNNVYDSNEEPVMVILSPGEKDQITNMHPDCTKYCVYPDPWTSEEIKKWMKGNYEKVYEKVYNSVEEIDLTGKDWFGNELYVKLQNGKTMFGHVLFNDEKIHDWFIAEDSSVIHRSHRCHEGEQVVGWLPIPPPK